MDYQFAPSPKHDDINFANWQDVFTSEELDKIIEIGDALTLKRATVRGEDEESTAKQIRDAKTGWIEMNDETRFIFDRLAFVARSLNGKFFNFDLHGFSEPIQYTVYEGTDNHHYTWHMDKGGSGGMPQRKLSMVVQLSHPHDYEGGELEILESAVPTAVNKERGIIHAFPGYILHRVTPVTAGVRKTLVVWVGGTPFR